MATAIEVEHLTKTFPGKAAVEDISFSIEQGQVVGFLGPNGAGKTTTIRMLTCFLSITHGRASVMGFDVFDQSVEVRKRLGYLPEATPVYPEMRVEEYLRYRARLKGVARSKTTDAVGSAMERTRIDDVSRRIIGQLSKGYRQRVGLADALVASPPLLILDEPTIGLDPNQIRQTRSLIRELGQDHTVFLSTHILPEVEQVCDRVLIIHKGKIKGEGTPSELRERTSEGTRLRLEARGQRPDLIRRDVAEIDGVSRVELVSGDADGDEDDVYQFAVLAAADAGVREDIFYAAVDGEWVLRELATEAMSLEEVFAHITDEDEEGEADDDEYEDDEGDDENGLDDEDELDDDEEPDEEQSDEDDEGDDDAARRDS